MGIDGVVFTCPKGKLKQKNVAPSHEKPYIVVEFRPRIQVLAKHIESIRKRLEDVDRGEFYDERGYVGSDQQIRDWIQSQADVWVQHAISALITATDEELATARANDWKRMPHVEWTDIESEKVPYSMVDRACFPSPDMFQEDMQREKK